MDRGLLGKNPQNRQSTVQLQTSVQPAFLGCWIQADLGHPVWVLLQFGAVASQSSPVIVSAQECRETSQMATVLRHRLRGCQAHVCMDL